jgi:hypothetical protein
LIRPSILGQLCNQALGTAGPPLAGYAFDFFHSYTIPIAAGGAATFVGFLLVYLAPEPGQG